MKIFIVIIASFCVSVSIIFFACKKNAPPEVSCSEKSNLMAITKKLLPGTYSWSYTIITYQGSSTVETPASTALNYKYVFDKNGIMYYYENNALKSTDNYMIDYEFKVTTYPSDSATIVIINDNQTNQRKEFFRPYLCNDSALFYNPYNSIESKRYFKRD